MSVSLIDFFSIGGNLATHARPTSTSGRIFSATEVIRAEAEVHPYAVFRKHVRGCWVVVTVAFLPSCTVAILPPSVIDDFYGLVASFLRVKML